MDVERARELYRKIGGALVVAEPRAVFDVLSGEHRLKMDRLSADRLVRATWFLAGATVVLALATVALIFATIVN